MDNQQLFKERVDLFRRAIEFKKVYRVPLISSAFSSKVCDTGYKLSQALFDYNIYKEVMQKYHEKYNFDVYHENGFRNPLRIARALANGKTNYIINDELNSINYPDIAYMQPYEYDDVIEDFDKYIWEKFIFHKYPNLTKEQLLNGIKETAALGKYLEEITEILASKYGVPPLNKYIYFTPFEFLFNGMRGIKETSLDIRRRPEKIKEALKAIRKTFNLLDLLKGMPKGPVDTHCVDVHTVLLGHTILSAKQFEEIYWPYLKELVDYAVQNDKRLYIHAEGANERFYDFFQEIPKGYVAIWFELDDIFEAKKKIGDKICLCGGFPVVLLQKGTPRQCVDYAKRLIDDLGAADGGYIFSTDKMLSFRSDVNEENMKAITEFVRNYTF